MRIILLFVILLNGLSIFAQDCPVHTYIKLYPKDVETCECFRWDWASIVVTEPQQIPPIHGGAYTFSPTGDGGWVAPIWAGYPDGSYVGFNLWSSCSQQYAQCYKFHVEIWFEGELYLQELNFDDLCVASNAYLGGNNGYVAFRDWATLSVDEFGNCLWTADPNFLSNPVNQVVQVLNECGSECIEGVVDCN